MDYSVSFFRYFPILPSYWFGDLCTKNKDVMPQRPRTTTDTTPPVDSDGEPYKETVPLFASHVSGFYHHQFHHHYHLLHSVMIVILML